MTLIGGQAGVGKSRLAAEAIRLAQEHGLSRLVGQCTPDPTVPYAPFVSALRRRTRTLDTDALARLFDGSAMLAAALLPEAAKAVGLPQDPPAREDLFAAVWQLLNRLAAPDGCLLLIEDIHWADTDSLQLLTYLARELADLPVWLVGTYRNDELHRRHPLTPVLAELGRERRYEEILLPPLGRDEVGEMMSAIFDGTEVGDEFLDAVFDRTAGNPFFVEELVKVLVERGDIYHEAGDWARRDLAEIEMPLTVRETLLARARSLDPTTIEVFHLAAMAGDRIEIPVLAAAAGVEPATIEDAVREGLRLQLLAERRDGRRTVYAFRHALTREAFADDVVGPDRRRAHQRIAEALVEVHAGDLDAVAAELADHYAESGETSLAIEFGIRAARVAVASLALDEAARRYDRTQRLMPPDSPERLSLLLEAADVIVESPQQRRLAAAFANEATRRNRAGNPLREPMHAMYGPKPASPCTSPLG
jgi:predicted ATPase